MTPERLETLLEAYGADPGRWPDTERAAAQALLERSPVARRRLAEARELDALLDASPAPGVSAGLVDTIVAQLPRSRRRSVARLVRGLVPLAAAAGLVLWIGRSTLAPPADLPVDAVAALGTWNVPTDHLFADTGLAVIDSMPTFGCDDTLGCPELDATPVSESRRASERISV